MATAYTHSTTSPVVHAHRAPRAHERLDEEKSLLLTFIAFAIILALSALWIFGLAVDADGTSSLSSFTDSMGNFLTPGI